jgi:Zn-dependent protease with chaperone function
MNPEEENPSRTMTKKNNTAPKERGCWLSGWLILMILHGVLSSALIYYQATLPGANSPGWLGVLFLVAIADIVAAIGIWYWQRWGLILYAIATVVSIIVGLILTRTQLWVFHEIIPLAILGYLVKDKWAYFGIDTDQVPVQ